MRVTVLLDRAGKIESVAILGAEAEGTLHVELEDGAPARELEVDEKVVDRATLMGEKGREAQEEAYAKLRRMLSPVSDSPPDR